MILAHHPNCPRDPEIAIGYWRAVGRTYGSEPEIPFDPQDFVDPAWDPAERDLVIRYLEQGKIKHQWRGISPCRVCGCSNGSQCLTDGVYVWPQGLAHYVRAHNVRPPVAFVDHVKARSDAR